jgi:hypothetical protein
MDFPTRSRSPYGKEDAFTQAVRELPRDQRRRLSTKLFCGTDFPNFRVEDGWTLDTGIDASVVAASDLRYQVRCMENAFEELFDESAMVDRFLELLPPEDSWRLT